MNTVHTHKRHRRGMILVGVMMVLMMLMAFMLAGIGGTAGLSDVTRNSLHLTRKRSASYQAQNLADIGIRAVLQWISVQAGPPSQMTPFRPSQAAAFWTGTTANGNYDRITFTAPNGDTIGTIDVRILPAANNDVNALKSYAIESVGTYQGLKQVVRAVILQDTFARYAYFADNAPTGSFWAGGNSAFTGPVHVNARNTFASDPAYNINAGFKLLWRRQPWWDPNSPGTVPIFQFTGDGAFTTSASAGKVQYFKNTTTNQEAPSGADWNFVARGGQSTMRTDQPMVDMPTETNRQQDAALGTPPASVPAGPSVTVPSNGGATSGGIYINGDVDNMRMIPGDSDSRIQNIEIIQNDGVRKIKTYITVNPINETVSIQRSQTPNLTSNIYTNVGSATTLAGRTNGVVYVNGNIGKPSVPNPSNPNGAPLTAASGGLSGWISNNVMSGTTIVKQNAWTVATPPDKTVNLNGAISHTSLDGANRPTTASGMFGVVAGKIQFTMELPNNSRMHAILMANDTINAEGALSRSVATVGLYGGMIQKNPGVLAGFGADALQYTGVGINRNYDPRVASTPPPFFPTTGNQFRVVSYQRVASEI
ncbi:MAG: hypothetical protein SFU56_09115 [Capsulimonadales bacterium]|nr:hypothetical protein [Capsulimonadales bacterium]